MQAWRILDRGTDGAGRRGPALLVAGLTLTLGFLSSRGLAEEVSPLPAPVPEIELFWCDHYRLLEKKFPAGELDLVDHEIERIFGEVGIPVRLRKGSPTPDREAAASPLAVRIVLVPRSGDVWKLSRQAMGAVMGKELTTKTLYVFFPSVLRGIGDETGIDGRVRKPGELHRLALALARVVAHEVVHAIDPELPHVEEHGIMNARLTPRMLQRDELSFTAGTAARLMELLAERATPAVDRTNAAIAELLSK